MEKLGQDSVDHRQRQVVCISQDSFYKELDAEDRHKAFKGMFNFDHPGKYITILTRNGHFACSYYYIVEPLRMDHYFLLK